MTRHDIELAVEQLLRDENELQSVDSAHPGEVERLIRCVVKAGCAFASAPMAMEDLESAARLSRSERRFCNAQRRIEKRVGVLAAGCPIAAALLSTLIGWCVSWFIDWLLADSGRRGLAIRFSKECAA